MSVLSTDDISAVRGVVYCGGAWDGVTDDTAAIQAALDTGKNVRFPPGSAKITAPLRLVGSGRFFLGSGRGVTTIIQHAENTPIFEITGSRSALGGLLLSWLNIQTVDQPLSSAIKAKEKSDPNAILATYAFSSIAITKCAKGVDLGNSIGYSCSFVDMNVSSFSIAALYTDSETAFTQSYFNAWHINNQPLPYYSSTAGGGSTTTIILPVGASAVDDYYNGMSIVLTGGPGASGTVRWVTDYDAASRVATFYPASGVAVTSATTYSIARMAESSSAPMTFKGFTDLRIGMIAFEFIQLSSANPCPIFFEACQVVSIALLRYERVCFKATNSALISASGRTVVNIQAIQTQYCAALTSLGATNFFYGRTYAQGQIIFNTLERDGWQITSSAKWALSSGASAADRNERPYGGVVFNQIPSGDTNISPVGQTYDYLSPRNQTAITGRPSAEQRGASLDEGMVGTYSHNLMDRPDIVRFNTPLTADITFALDASNYVAGAEVTVVRGPAATGAFNILVKLSSTTLATLTTTGSVRLYCTGTGYVVL